MAQEILNIGTVADDGTGDALRDAMSKTKNNFAEIYTNANNIGFFDYNDLATHTTAISVTGGAGFVDITNDGAGANTNTSYPPVGVTQVWDTTTDVFDWSELALGDMIDIRLDLSLTTTLPNTAVVVELALGTGAGSYSIPFVVEQNFKNAGTYNLNRFNGIYIGDANTRDNGGKFRISADITCSIEVNGWYCKVIKSI